MSLIQNSRLRQSRQRNGKRSEHRSRATKALVLAAVAGAGGLLAPAPCAWGVVRTWIGPSGSWSVASNWSGGVVPANGDDALISTSDSTGRLVTYDFAPGVTLGTLSLSSVPLLGAGSDAMTQAANAITASTELIGIGAVSGVAGNGAYTQSGGTNTINSGLSLGFNATGRGTYTLSNTGVINLNGTLFDGNNGIGTFTQTGGTINGSGNVNLGFTASGKGTYTLNGASATLNASGIDVGVNGAGTFVHSAGTASLTGPLTVGDQSTATGLYTLSGGSLLIGGSSNNEYIGNGGTGAFTQTGGTHILSSTVNTSAAGFMFIANNPGSVGTYSLSGATSVLSVSNSEDIGEGGLGTFSHGGGTNTTVNLYVGDLSAGTYLMSGAGTLNVVPVGNSSNQSFLGVGNSSAGTFLQTGGTVNVGTPQSFLPQLTGELTVGGFGTASLGYYKLSAGTVNLPQGALVVGGSGSGAGTFEQTGGKVTLNGLLFIGAGPGTVGTGTYLLSGGTLTANPLTVNDSNGNPLLLDGGFVDPGGTLIGGASGGFFTGKLTQQGGTIAGVFRNQGTFVYQSGAFTAQLLNQGTFILNGITFAPSQTITNDDLGAINAIGTIAIGVINRGNINPTGGALFVSTVTNNGAINVPSGTSFSSGFVDNFGRIIVSGGELLGTGTITNEATGVSGGGVLSGGGTVGLNITQSGGTLRADNPAHPLIITTPIVITDTTSQIVVAPNSTLSLQSALANSAVIVMQGAGAALSGATITNTGTIRGAGDIDNQIVNNGVLRAEGGGALNLNDPNDANISGQIQVPNGSTIRFTQGMQINGATISLTGGEFDNGTGSLTNNGAILGRGTLRTAAAGLTNNGSIILSGGASDVFGAVTNHGPITVTGNGATTFYNAFTNSTGGSMSITLGSTAVFLGPVSGLSSFIAGAGGGGVKDFEGVASGGGINTVNGSTIVGPSGNITFTTLRDDTAQIMGRASSVPNGTSTGTVRLNTLLIAGSPSAWTGKLDLADNDMIIDYSGTSPLATVQNQIKTGYAGGAWTGNGITSSAAATASTTAHKTALGYAEAAALGVTTFSGQSVDSTSVLIRYTFAGDANLDGVVDTLDFNSLAANFGGTNKLWNQADFNYDGVVDTLDFNNLAANFGQSLPAQSQTIGALVPEPHIAFLAAAGALGAVWRRGRSRAHRRGHS